jgi:hypothetical protein
MTPELSAHHVGMHAPQSVRQPGAIGCAAKSRPHEAGASGDVEADGIRRVASRADAKQVVVGAAGAVASRQCLRSWRAWYASPDIIVVRTTVEDRVHPSGRRCALGSEYVFHMDTIGDGRSEGLSAARAFANDP